MGFQVARQVLDSLSQYGNLDFGRTRILVVQLVVRDDLTLLFFD